MWRTYAYMTANTKFFKMRPATQNQVAEWAYSSSKVYDDPFNEVTLDVDITDPGGQARTIPAFWRGQNSWGVRYASGKIGLHRYRTRCSDADNGSLHGQEGAVEVTPYDGDNPLFRHGPLRVADSGRHLEHRDGTPFFWLADTWWMGLVKRLPWPDGFKRLTADRVQERLHRHSTGGRALTRICPPLTRAAPMRADSPGREEFTRINPAYFDLADRRIDWLVQSGLASEYRRLLGLLHGFRR